MFYAVRIVKQMVEVDFFGEKQFVPNMSTSAIAPT
jgi:hypothetical protein